jgi:hypothetical protein
MAARQRDQLPPLVLPCLQVFVSDANSTAYQYPMVDAKVFRDSSGAVAAEVPLVSLAAGASTRQQHCRDARVRGHNSASCSSAASRMARSADGSSCSNSGGSCLQLSIWVHTSACA